MEGGLMLSILDVHLSVININSLRLFLTIMMLSYCTNTHEYIKNNIYNDCYEETAKGVECHHSKETVNYKKLREEYPRVPSNNSIYREHFMRK